MSRRKLQQDYW